MRLYYRAAGQGSCRDELRACITVFQAVSTSTPSSRSGSEGVIGLSSGVYASRGGRQPCAAIFRERGGPLGPNPRALLHKDDFTFVNSVNGTLKTRWVAMV